MLRTPRQHSSKSLNSDHLHSILQQNTSRKPCQLRSNSFIQLQNPIHLLPKQSHIAMDNLHETAVDESHADVSLEDHTGDTTEEEDATYDNDLDRLIEILPTRPNQALTTMVAMPWKRHVALSPNKMCEIKSGPRRKCNQEAALCQTRGDICEEPCVPCGKGLGIFAQCIVVPGQFGGACGSCRYNMKNAQCNLQYNCAFLHSILLSNHLTNS